jgi:parallel beta-helix repeat protein
LAQPGNIVRVLAGTYPETVKPTNSGSDGMYISYIAAPDVTVTGNGLPNTENPTGAGGAFRVTNKSYIVIYGFTVNGTADHGITVSNSQYIRIHNNHVSYSGSPTVNRTGIYLNETTNSTISYNTTDHNFLDGIRLNGSSFNTVSNNLSYGNAAQVGSFATGINFLNGDNNFVARNIAYANEDTGLNFYLGSSNNIVVNNVSYGNGDHGIDNNDSPYNIIIGNTVQGNVTSGINLEGNVYPGLGSSGARIINNIVVDNGLLLQEGGGYIPIGKKGNIQVDPLSTNGTILDFNLYYLTSGGTQLVWANVEYRYIADFNFNFPLQEAYGLLDNPRFIAPAPIAMRPASAPYNMAINVGDYNIQPNSPAIDSAYSNEASEQTHDILGNPRVDNPSIPNSGYGMRTYDDRGAYEFFNVEYFNGYKIMIPLIFQNLDISGYYQ